MFNTLREVDHVAPARSQSPRDIAEVSGIAVLKSYCQSCESTSTYSAAETNDEWVKPLGVQMQETLPEPHWRSARLSMTDKFPTRHITEGPQGCSSFALIPALCGTFMLGSLIGACPGALNLFGEHVQHRAGRIGPEHQFDDPREGHMVARRNSDDTTIARCCRTTSQLEVSRSMCRFSPPDDGCAGSRVRRMLLCM
jgi:hypothetical protein